PPRGLLDQEPLVFHRPGAGAARLRPEGGRRRRRGADRGLVPAGGLAARRPPPRAGAVSEGPRGGGRAARLTLAVGPGRLGPAVATGRLPGFWGDGATYYSMAWSLAEDGDLRYEARDLLRARRDIPSGPQGIFLKRASGGLAWDGAGGFPRLRRVSADEPRI